MIGMRGVWLLSASLGACGLTVVGTGLEVSPSDAHDGGANRSDGSLLEPIEQGPTDAAHGADAYNPPGCAPIPSVSTASGNRTAIAYRSTTLKSLTSGAASFGRCA